MNKTDLIEEIIRTEFAFFDRVNNEGGRASCQDNWPTFHLMRSAQFAAWNMETLLSYREDLERAEKEGRNPVAEKYAYMMEYSSPAEYENIKEQLPECTAEKQRLVEELLACFLKQTEEFMQEYPSFRETSRPVYAAGDRPFFTSIETYMRGELKTYSEKTLQAYLSLIREEETAGRKIVYQIYENTAHGYGYASLEEADRKQRRV